MNESSFWTSQGGGEYKGNLIIANIKSIDSKKRRVIPDDKNSAVIPLINYDNYDQQICGWKEIGKGFYIPLASWPNMFMGYLNNSYREFEHDFSPIAFVMNNSQGRRDFELCNYKGKFSVFTCLNKNGKAPDFPPTIEELLNTILSEYVSNPEAMKYSSYIGGIGKEEALENLKKTCEENESRKDKSGCIYFERGEKFSTFNCKNVEDMYKIIREDKYWHGKEENMYCVLIHQEGICMSPLILIMKDKNGNPILF